MKNIFAFMTVLALTHGVFAQTSKQIADIENARQEIKSNISAYQTKFAKYTDSTSFRKVYLQDGNIKLVTVNHRDNTVDKYVEWYFSNGQLIYSEQIWTDLPSKKVIDSQKCYLVNGHLIAWQKTDGSRVDNMSEEFQEVDKGLAEFANSLIRGH